MSKILSIIVLIFSATTFAQETGGFIEEDAHEHGAALLNVAQDGSSLSLEFISPSVNIVGFEYQPSTDEERAAVETAVNDLSDGAALFSPSSAAGCELADVEVESAIEVGPEGEEHEEGEEGHEEGEEHKEGEAHSEFHAMYEFTCANPGELTGLELADLFALYPGIEDLDAQYALDSGQGAAELNADSTQLTF